MILLIVILIIESVFFVALAILAYIAIQDSNRQARGWAAARRGNEEYRAENDKLAEALKSEAEALETTRILYKKLQQENAALNARNTALVEAMEAKPTQPKRTVRKNSIARIDISEGEPL